MDIFVLTFISFFIAVLVETLRLKSFKKVQDTAVEMFKGMGQGFSQVVMLVVGGSLFTSAIQTLELLIVLWHLSKHQVQQELSRP